MAAIYGSIKILMELFIITAQSAATVYHWIAWKHRLLCRNWRHIKPMETTGLVTLWRSTLLNSFFLLCLATDFQSFSDMAKSPETHVVVSTSIRRCMMSYDVALTLKQRCVSTGVTLNLHQSLGFCKDDISKENHYTTVKLCSNKSFI